MDPIRPGSRHGRAHSRWRGSRTGTGAQGSPPHRSEEGARGLADAPGDACRRSRVPRAFDEVALGYDLEAALVEADRCIRCTKPKCIEGCPVRIDIPGFIAELAAKDLGPPTGS